MFGPLRNVPNRIVPLPTMQAVKNHDRETTSAALPRAEAVKKEKAIVNKISKPIHYPFWFGGSASCMAACVTHPLDLSELPHPFFFLLLISTLMVVDGERPPPAYIINRPAVKVRLRCAPATCLSR